MTTCDRCGAKTHGTRMSWFNLETICMDCARIEIKHPKYEEARIEERKSWEERGEFNFSGIGAPPDLIKQSIEERAQREKEGINEQL